MSTIENDRKYTKEHEWAHVDATDPAIVAIGVSDYAQAQLGDVVMVELPEIGDEFDEDEIFGAVESPKSVSDLFMPVAGEVVAVNEALLDEPELVNSSPYGSGWIIRVRVNDPGSLSGLMDGAGYKAFIEGLDD